MFGQIGYNLDPADEPTPDLEDEGDFSNADSWDGSDEY